MSRSGAAVTAPRLVPSTWVIGTSTPTARTARMVSGVMVICDFTAESPRILALASKPDELHA